ncbi:hypothetical protein AB0A60_32920 [Streptomyces sp. NPDC046275]|uniref:hypothetical protein n=1 Tax=Streptomyces sp. NPDC046275 TaxID=3157201 RepID=UPI0033FC329D
MSGELHGLGHLGPRAFRRRGRHARPEGGTVCGAVMIAGNTIGLALAGWIGASELNTARAAPAVTAPDQPFAEEQPPAADATAMDAPVPAPPERGHDSRACRCGSRPGPIP